VSIERFDVYDVPTPLIALQDFVNYVEQSILKGKNDESSATGYWQRQKTIQYNEFFDYLDLRIEDAGMIAPSVGYFDYKNSQDFRLPD